MSAEAYTDEYIRDMVDVVSSCHVALDEYSDDHEKLPIKITSDIKLAQSILERVLEDIEEAD